MDIVDMRISAIVHHNLYIDVVSLMFGGSHLWQGL